MKELGFIGGDMRQIRVINEFSRMKRDVRIYGFEKAKGAVFEDSVTVCASAEDVISGSRVIILPLPYTSGREIINAPYSDKELHTGDIMRLMKEGQILLLGKADEGISAIAKLYGVHFIDYFDREELAVLNAIPTAEGAIELAMQKTPYTIHGSRCLILGYGRIGKVLASMLKGIGAHVCVCVRKHKDAALCRTFGIDSIYFQNLREEIGDFDTIFNTVPHVVVGYKELQKARDESLIIDLASSPGGVDFETAEVLKKQALQALSLPGKVAPQTAGDFIKDTILNILDELGV